VEERLGVDAGGFRFAIDVAGVLPTEGVCISPTGVRVAPSPFPSSFRLVNAGAVGTGGNDDEAIRLEEQLGGGECGAGGFRFAIDVAGISPTEGICISPTGVCVAPSPFPSSFRVVVVDAGAAIREIADALLHMIRLEERVGGGTGGGAGGGGCFRFAAGAAAVAGGGGGLV